MRYFTRSVAGATAFLAISLLSSAYAGVIAVDSFSYPPGNLNGLSGGSGWTGGWSTGSMVVSAITPSTALNYSMPGGKTLDGGSGALQVGATNANGLFSRALAASENADDVYFSVLARWSSGTMASGKTATFYFADAVVDTWTNNSLTTPNIGIRINANGTSDLVARFGNGSTTGYTASSTDITAGNTYLIVGRLHKSVSGVAGRYDQFSLWVNPSAGDASTPLATATASGPTSFSQLWFRTANLGGTDAVQFDEVTLATSWADAVPIPEPVATGSLALGSLMLLTPRRCRKLARS